MKTNTPEPISVALSEPLKFYRLPIWCNFEAVSTYGTVQIGVCPHMGRHRERCSSLSNHLERKRVFTSDLLEPFPPPKIALQLIQNNIVSAPDLLREQLRAITRMQLIRTLAARRPEMPACRDVTSAYRIALKSLGCRYLELHGEIADMDTMIAALVDALAPDLIARQAIGYETAARLLLTAGDNMKRLHTEAEFAALCGVSPVPAVGERPTPSAEPWRRLRHIQRPAHHRHRQASGRSSDTSLRSQKTATRKLKDGSLRCLKRYIAREVFYSLRSRNIEIAAQISA